LKVRNSQLSKKKKREIKLLAKETKEKRTERENQTGKRTGLAKEEESG